MTPQELIHLLVGFTFGVSSTMIAFCYVLGWAGRRAEEILKASELV